MAELTTMRENVRSQCLTDARQCVNGARDQQYGNPEDNFGLIARLWTLWIDKPDVTLTAGDVAMMMALLKLARIKTGRSTYDSYVDLAGYAACGAEIYFKDAKLEED